MKQDVLLHPSEVRLFGSDAVMTNADEIAGLLEEFRHVEDLQFPDNPEAVRDVQTILGVSCDATCLMKPQRRIVRRKLVQPFHVRPLNLQKEAYMFTETFKALNKEAQFTKEMLGAGATQIRKANYATKGIYFQAFTSLSTGLERIGKLCLMLDHFIDHNKQFPDFHYMKNEIGHKIGIIYDKSLSVISKRSITMRFLPNLDDPIHQSALKILAEFAQGDRYSNIDLIVGAKRQSDPIASWFKEVDMPLYETRVSNKKKETIDGNAAVIAAMLAQHALVRHTSETGGEITDVEDASRRTGMQTAVAPYRQLYVLQIIRYWVELLGSLQYAAMQIGGEDIPFFSEVFGMFYNDDSYIKTRKTWDTI